MYQLADHTEPFITGDLSTLFNDALNNIYKELVDVKKEIEPNLFNHTWQALNKAVDTEFGSISHGDPNFDFLNELKYNNGVFAAFKTHRQQNDLAAQLLDKDGNLKPFEQFKTDTQQILGEYNKNWLKTEYDTAVIRARMAARFKKFERDADLYPNLMWLESTSAHPREAHMELYGIIRPINDPFWLKYFPGMEWNCKCGITNTDEPVTDLPIKMDEIPDAPPGLDENPVVKGEIYAKSHPYFASGYADFKKLGKTVKSFVSNQMLDYTEKLLTNFKQSLPIHNGLDINSDNLISGSVKILRRTITDVKGHNADWRKLQYLANIEENVNDWKYLGWKPVETYPKGHKLAGEIKHPETEYFLYYESTIDGKKVYMNVKMHKVYKKEVLYCITDRIENGVIHEPYKK